MKSLFLFSLFSVGMLQVNSQNAYVAKPVALPVFSSVIDNSNDGNTLTMQPGLENEKMSAAVFKNQEYCRAELDRFEFDVHFVVVGATVYFSGANFHGIEKGTIKSSSLKPIKDFMARCTSGSIVSFDDVKVVGPDNKVRTIPGASYYLY